MKQLGANAIRVYHVDASADHSGCMNAFAENNIYVWVDMDSFKTYIRYVRVLRHLTREGMLTMTRTPIPHGRPTNRTRIAPSWTISNSMTTLRACL